MARVLDLGGRLVLADGVRDVPTARIADAILRRLDRSHVRLYSSDELGALMSSAGFSELGVSTLYGGGYAIVSGRRTTAAANGGGSAA